MRARPAAVVAVAVVALVGAVVAGERAQRRSARRLLGPAPGTTGSGEAVVVLGFANRGRRANAVNRWRARAALRACRPDLGPSRLVLCGSAARGPVPEADLLADRVRAPAEARGIAVVLERESRSTWENVANACALVEDVDRIKLVSQPLHAEKARLYLWRQRPDLAERLVPVEGSVDGWTVLAPLLVLHGRWRLRAARRALR